MVRWWMVIAAAAMAACSSSGTTTTDSACKSGVKWTAGDQGSPEMHPGGDCIGCHTSHAEGPQLAIAGTVYAANLLNYTFKSSVTGKAMERASIAQLEQFLNAEYPELDLDAALQETEDQVDRFRIYESLLLPLEHIKQNPRYHPEGDVLYHSMQVFELARDHVPYDEELLLAALLHDVGKGIDPHDHVRSGLEALGGFITERTHWLIEHHMAAHAMRDGQLGARAARRLREHGEFELDDLLLLSQCDRQGRAVKVEAPELDEALEYIRELADECG